MTLLDTVVERIGRTKSLDAPAKRIRRATNPLFKNRAVVDVASGKQLGHPLHPALVVLPLGSFLSASLVDMSSKQDADLFAQRLITAGVVTSIPTMVAGLSDWRYTSGPERRVGLVHAVTNTVALGIYVGSLRARKKGKIVTGKVLAFVGSSLLGVSGALGGHLSYAMGVGVDTNAFGAEPTDWVRVARESDIRDDGMYTSAVGGERILLSRKDGEVTAVGNRCSHRGAPLDQGERQGDCVKCPWHASVFDIKTGEVIEGPAVRPLPRYDVRIKDGMVEIRRAVNHTSLQTNADVVDLTSHHATPTK